MNKYLTILKKWFWLFSIFVAVLGWVYSLANDKINMERDIKDLKVKMEEQQKKQMTEKDVIVLIQLLKEDSKQNLNYLTKILQKH